LVNLKFGFYRYALCCLRGALRNFYYGSHHFRLNGELWLAKTKWAIACFIKHFFHDLNFNTKNKTAKLLECHRPWVHSKFELRLFYSVVAIKKSNLPVELKHKKILKKLSWFSKKRNDVIRKSRYKPMSLINW
jgi:hypothetical protein